MAATKTNAFDYLSALKSLCADICWKMPEFQHIDVNRVAFGAASAKNVDSEYGEWADVTPLRFKDGWSVEVRKTRNSRIGSPVRYFTTQQLLDEQKRPYLYIMTLMTPRFYNLPACTKLRTIMHELYHISPNFDGDVRRFPGRHWQHGSREKYNERAEAFAQKWLKMEPDPALYNFLSLNHAELLERFKKIVTWKIPRIRVLEISRERALELEPRLAEK